MKPPYFLRKRALLLASFTLALGHAHAATLYWDTNDSAPGAGAVPSDSWITDGSTWSTSTNGTLAVSALTTTADDDLVFSAGTDTTGSYTITLDTAQLAKSLTFRSGTATISGAGGGVINLGGTGIINVPNSLTATPLSAVIGDNSDTLISGSAGLTKTGVGTLTLDGSTPHTFTGGLNATGGTLALNFSNLATPTDFLASGNALSFGGGAITLTGKDTGDSAQTLGNVTVNSGGGDFRVNPNNGDSTTVTLGSLTTSASGGSLIIGRALGSGTGTLAITTTTDKGATGIYGGRVVFANGTANTGYDWATTVTESPGPFELSAYTGYVALAPPPGTDTNNSSIVASATMTGSRTTNSLKFAPTATGQTLTIGAGNTLTLTSGGLLMTSGQTNMNIDAITTPATAGSITAGDGSGPADLVVHQFNPSQPLGIGVTGPNLGNTPEIFSAITDNGDQPVTLVKNGPGSIRFLGTNTFTGGIIVNQGSVDFGASALNNNPITFNANAFFYTAGSHVTSGGITLNNGSQVTICNNNSSFTVNANVTGTGGISAAQGGQGAITLNLNGTGNTFSGPIRFTANNGSQPATINVGSLVDTDTFGTGNITFCAGTATPTANTFGIASTATEPITLTNRNFEMAGDLVLHTINNNSSQAFAINPDLRVIGNRAKNLQLSGTGTGVSTFAGVIGNHPTPSAPGTIRLAVRTTAAAGSLTLASVEGISVGATITGTSIAAGTTITAINPFTRVVTLSQNTTAGIGLTNDLTIPDVVNSFSLTKAGTGTWVLAGDSNSYTGATFISAGVLEVTKLADIGENSSIGRGGAGVSNLYLGQAATLRYTGSTDSSTNRVLSSTTGGNNTGFILDASGAGTVGFTSTAAITNSSNNQGRYFTLTGENTGNNTLAAQINNNGTSTDNTNIIKNGGGKWVLTNPNSSFTGAVFINNGTLSTSLITNSTVASPLGAGSRFTLGNANNNGTLDYTGSGDSSNRDTRIGTPSTVPGTGGGSILNNGSGALTFTAATFNIAQTGITDTRTLALGGSYTGSANEIQGIIQDNAATGLVNLEKSGPGTWKLSGANTYTGNTTVNEGTLELADNAQLKFVLGATSGINNAITGAGNVTLDGDFVIDTTAADGLPSGTWTLENVSSLTGAYGSSFTVLGFTDLGDDKWEKALSPTKKYTFDETTGILTLATTGEVGYAAWASINGAGPNLNDDHDNDGVSNGVEYFLGGTTDTTGFTALPGVTNTGGTLSVTWTKAATYAGNYGTDFVVETSATLEAGSWTTEILAPNPGATVTISGDDVTYTFPAGTKNFARLVVTGP
jgi:fibronectin-binding autotransporter adhesin